MNTHHRLARLALLTGALLLTGGLSLAQVAPPPNNDAGQPKPNSNGQVVTVTTTTTTTDTASSHDDDVSVLSPFEVTSSKDVGYQANETLAGTRIRTNLADVGSSIQVITKEFMQDVGATGSASLLMYTTNAEVGGTRGTYLGDGNGTSVNETNNLRDPEGDQRIRGLAAADNSRDFFVTDIPWDSYNVDRIDIQRGPNAMLFGLGSPAGIINATTNGAEFRNFGSISDTSGSYGSQRLSLDINQALLPDVLAIRFDALRNDQRFEETQAFQNDKRYSGALEFDPKLFKRDGFNTSIKLKYEHGDIGADRPRSLPPYDSITPWFAPANTTSLNGGLGKASVVNGYVLGSSASTYNPLLGGVTGQQQPVWFIDGTSDQLYRIYGGFVNTGALNAAGNIQGAGTNLLGQKYADVFSDVSSLSQYAINAKLPNSQYGQYRDQTLTDPTIFNYDDNLIDGPTASQFERWSAFNADLQQTFWGDRAGFELTYDRQRYTRGGDNLIGGSNSNPTLDIDLLQNFQDYVTGPNDASNASVANPNFGRPFVAGGPGQGSSYSSDRENIRASLFGEVRASDFFDPSSFMAKLLGKHRFNGVASNEKYFTENLTWQDYANSEAYAAYKLQGNPDGITNLAPVAVIYLGPSLANASTASGANITGITSNVALQDGGIYQSASTWDPAAGVVFNAPWTVPANLQPFFGATGGANYVAGGAPYSGYTQVSNPGNYQGWNSNFTDNLLRYNNGADKSLLTAASKSLRETKSYAGSWQGFLWNDAIVPALGWRYDEVESKGVSALPQSGATARGALNLDPEVYTLPDSFLPNEIFKGHSTTESLVVHLNKLLGEHDFLPINISLTADNSSNFQVTNIRQDVYGNSIPNPTGKTREYGILLATKDGKYSFRVVKYDTLESNSTVPGFNPSGIYGTIRDALNWRNIKLYDMSAYAWNTAGGAVQPNYSGSRYGWDPVYVDANGRDVASGQATTGIPAGATLETEAQAQAHEDAAITAINNMQIYLAGQGYFTAWNYGVGPTTQSALQTPSQRAANPIQPVTASVYDYRTAPLEQNFAVTDDTESKGYEFELTANPLPNWRVGFNAAQTKAVISNVGGAALDGLVSYMDTLMAGPAGDLIRFNSDYSAANELRADWSGWRSQYTLLKLEENTAAPELRTWRYNVVTNYGFDHGFLKGAGIGAGYRWQDKVIIGYPVLPNPTNPTLATFDLTQPYYGPAESALDLWASYAHKITRKVDWRIQLNIYNVGKKDGLIPISVEPDGHTWAAARIAPVQEWQLSNTFSF
jgi:outer membrane receptor protein involved in Fe transport